MELKTVKSALLMTLAAATSGCGSKDGEFVNFEQTPPSQLDQQTASLQSDADGTAVIAGPPTTQGDPLPAIPIVASAANVGPEGSQSGNPPEATDGAAPATAVKTVSVNAAGPAEAQRPGVAVAPAERSENVVVSAQSGLTGPADNPLVENAVPTAVRPITVLIPSKNFRKERGSNAVRVTYDDVDLLKVLNMEPVPVDAVEHFPEWLNSLNGKPIRIRGFMYPTYEATGLKGFTLARDNGICCFVRQPKIYDIIGVTLTEGNTTDYIEGRPFDVEGVFHIEPEADDKDLFRLYRIDHARVVGTP